MKKPDLTVRLAAELVSAREEITRLQSLLARVRRTRRDERSRCTCRPEWSMEAEGPKTRASRLSSNDTDHADIGR